METTELVDFWSRASDQMQMHPDRDIIAKLLPAVALVCLLVFLFCFFFVFAM